MTANLIQSIQVKSKQIEMAANTSQEEVVKSQEVVKVDDTVLPHLESLDRMMKLPVVEAAWHQSQGYYDKVRGELSDDDDSYQSKVTVN